MYYFLYYIERSTMPVERPFADQVLGYMFGFHQIIIDMTGETKSSIMGNPMVFNSLEEAIKHPELKNLKWVFFHAHAEQTLQEYKHPLDNVIYCVGSDWMGLGYGKEDLSKMGDVLRVAAPDPGEEYKKREFFATTLLPIVAYDRCLKLWQNKV